MQIFCQLFSLLISLFYLFTFLPFYFFTFLPLNIVPYPDLSAGLAEGVPRDVEPVTAGEQLVGVLAGLEEVHEALELLRVHRPDIGSLTNEVLRPGHTAHTAVHLLTTETGINDDRSHHLTGRLQHEQAADIQVHYVLECRDVIGILLQVEELAKKEVRR